MKISLSQQAQGYRVPLPRTPRVRGVYDTPRGARLCKTFFRSAKEDLSRKRGICSLGKSEGEKKGLMEKIKYRYYIELNHRVNFGGF